MAEQFAFLASLACAIAVTILILRAFQEQSLLKPLETVTVCAAAPCRIAVIVPARNEAGNIAACIGSLLAQRHLQDPPDILVVDDNSTDATAAIVSSLAASHANVRLLHSPALRVGWTGKCQACWLAAQAAPADTQWLCFIDADMICEPALLASAVAAATSDGIDLLSLAPRHRLLGFAERLMIPCGLFFLAFTQDLARRQQASAGDATANGQFLLMPACTYRAIGGHAAVHGAICEDNALARSVRRANGRIAMLDGSRLIATRMYECWAGLWEGFSKNLVEMLGGETRTFAGGIAAFVLAWMLVLTPIADIAVAHSVVSAIPALVLAGLALVAMTALHIAGARHFRIPFWYGFLFPVGYSIGAVMALDSLYRHRNGHVQWKGRVYP